MDQELKEKYGDRVRVRVCGLCWQGDTLLMVNHKHLGPEHFWSPPGGGIELWATTTQTLQREFLEETGLQIAVKEFCFAAEFISPPLHAIELFFEVVIVGGSLQKGFDPETHLQVIQAVEFKSLDSILALPVQERHGIFNRIQSPSDLRNLRGYVRLL